MVQLNDDTINPVTAEYIQKAIDQAEQDGAECLIIKLDTPGGLLNSTRLIIKRILTAEVPVVVYIAPPGSRAGSAGVFITYAAHVAAMAPSTNIGAAHPVRLGGGPLSRRRGDWRQLRRLTQRLQKEVEALKAKGDGKGGGSDKAPAQEGQDRSQEDQDVFDPDEEPMESKILQDTVAFIRSLARVRHRNEQWAAQSVRRSVAIPYQEALEKGVVDLVAGSDQELLEQLDGRTVVVNGVQKVLRTKGAIIQTREMETRQKILNILVNPNIAYFLMILGFYGLLFEMTHPGIGMPGITGVIFLILAFYSMQLMPTNYAGLALIALGLALFAAEAMAPGIGLLALGGLVSLVLGSLFLFDSVDPVMRVSSSAIVALSLSTGLLTVVLIRLAWQSRTARARGGQEGFWEKEGRPGRISLTGKRERSLCTVRYGTP